MTSVSATSVHIITNNTIIARIGVVGKGDDRNKGQINPGKILANSINNMEETYLPDLQILPGKIEFTYLPINCQSVLIVPFSQSGAVVVATNKAKSLKLIDLKKIRTTVSIFKDSID